MLCSRERLQWLQRALLARPVCQAVGKKSANWLCSFVERVSNHVVECEGSFTIEQWRKSDLVYYVKAVEIVSTLGQHVNFNVSIGLNRR